MKSIALLTGVLLVFVGDVCAQDYNGFIKKLTGYQKSVKLSIRPSGDGWERVRINPETFNMGDYMALYPALKVRPGCKADCFYYSATTAGWPCLFARDTGMIVEQLWGREIQKWISASIWWKHFNERAKESGMTAEEKEKRGNALRDSLYDAFNWGVRCHFAMDDSANFAKYHLIPEDNEMGYFQLVMFHVIGDNFGWYWHAYYNYHYILYESAQIEELSRLNREGDGIVGLNEEEVQKLLKQDITPRVEMEEEVCRVTFYEFSTFGIFRKVYSVGRKNPYPAKLIEETKLLENDMQIIF